MTDLYPLFRPLLFKLDPERAHEFTLRTMKAGLMPPVPTVQNKALEVDLWGLSFPNPVGLAGGFDKNAEVIAPVLGLGFGFVEAGTVTPKPQEGNEKPRVFRDVKNQAVINRMGMPNHGVDYFRSNFKKFLQLKNRPPGIVGINIGMNKSQTDPVQDYAFLIRELAPMADYLTVNISSPNTPGLRDLQRREPLLELLGALKDEREKICGEICPPIMVKIAPDLDNVFQEELARTVLDGNVEGLILTNTTLARPDQLTPSFAAEKGGLSGQPLKNRSTEIIRNFYKLTKGKIPIIGLGGISSGADAYEKIRAGASLVQLYTGMVFKGPGLPSAINRELLALLKKDGFAHISQATGADHK